jgi:hypothetical protein
MKETAMFKEVFIVSRSVLKLQQHSNAVMGLM